MWKPILLPHLDNRRLQHLHCDYSNDDHNDSCGNEQVYSQIHYKLHQYIVLVDSLYHGEHSTEQLHLCSEGVDKRYFNDA